MASPATLKALIEALQAEQARRRKAQYGGHDDPREWLLETLQTMAERMARAASSPHPLDINDMSIAEKLACRYFLPENLCPTGLGTEDVPISLPRFHYRVGLHIVLFEVCSAFTRVAACTLAQSPDS
jgi:hypothetical protein